MSAERQKYRRGRGTQEAVKPPGRRQKLRALPEMPLPDSHGVVPIRRPRDFCYFADIPSPSVLKHLLKVEGGAAEWQSFGRRRRWYRYPARLRCSANVVSSRGSPC